MDHMQVQLIGVFGTQEEPIEGFCYTVNAPVNLWVGARCTDGSRMGSQFMGYVLNTLIDADGFSAGSQVEVADQGGTRLVAVVGEEVPKRDVQANLAHSDTVRVVTVTVIDTASCGLIWFADGSVHECYGPNDGLHTPHRCHCGAEQEDLGDAH
jgi:hypothetical protein